MRENKKPSDIIIEFLDLLDFAIAEYEKSDRKCKELDDKFKIWAHEFEFANNKGIRNKLATAYHKERLERRASKDINDLYIRIYEFVKSENNKPTLKRLKAMLERQQHQEDYLESEREYKGLN